MNMATVPAQSAGQSVTKRYVKRVLHKNEEKMQNYLAIVKVYPRNLIFTIINRESFSPRKFQSAKLPITKVSHNHMMLCR